MDIQPLAQALRDARATLTTVLGDAGHVDPSTLRDRLRSALDSIGRAESALAAGAEPRSDRSASDRSGTDRSGSMPRGTPAKEGASSREGARSSEASTHRGASSNLPASQGASSNASVASSRSADSSRDVSSSRVQSLEERAAELESAVTLHDEFLSTLGHELRNPLAPLYMQAQYLLDAVRSGEPKALSKSWLVSQLEGFCRRLSKFLETLDRIMDLSRMSAGQLNLELEEFDLVELVREVASGFERELAVARSELTLELPPRLLGVWDRLRMEQIINNLLSNAIRYGASKPIEIELGGDLEQIELAVRDHGIGIPEADHERVFRRFERAGKTRRTGGFGIGLWTVRQCCSAMGGQVSLRSEPGRGSRFSVMLPRVTEKEL